MFGGVVFKSLSFLSGLTMLFSAMPAGTNYKLQSYGVGSGGTANSTSSTYAMEGISGETGGTQLSSTNYKAGTGMISTQLANVPAAPTLTNPNNYYNKLLLVLDTGNNPADTKFAIAISSDNFVTTQYVKADHTVGSSLAISDYQTFTNWGGASGFLIIGLQSNTTYAVKVKAMQGKYTESGFSQTGAATTANPSITFKIDVSATDQTTSPPYKLSFSDLIPGTIVAASSKIWTSFSTNGDFGGDQFIYGQNAGLKSSAVSYTIPSVTGDLSAATVGFGAQNNSLGQASGGPMTVSSPYNGTSDTVGITDANIRKIYSSGAPVTSGRTSLQLKAKVASLTPSATDYAEVLTILAAASF